MAGILPICLPKNGRKLSLIHILFPPPSGDRKFFYQIFRLKKHILSHQAMPDVYKRQILVIFVMLRILPGNPAETMAGEHVSQAVIDKISREMGLDEPLYIQFFKYLANAVRGDFGTSYRLNRNVTGIILEAFPNTCLLYTSQQDGHSGCKLLRRSRSDPYPSGKERDLPAAADRQGR